MNTTKKAQTSERQPHFPSLEKIQQELGRAKSIDDFFGKDGIFAQLFAQTLETMLEAELTEQLGYERYAAKGRNSGNSRNGKRPKKLRTSAGDEIACIDGLTGFKEAIHAIFPQTEIQRCILHQIRCPARSFTTRPTARSIPTTWAMWESSPVGISAMPTMPTSCLRRMAG